MKPLDRYLRNVRISKAKRFVRPNDVVLDVGCADGAMFKRWQGLIKYGYGVEPTLSEACEEDGYALLPGHFPQALPKGVSVDVVTMLAVLEHVPRDEQHALPEQIHGVLNEGGRLVLTVPSPRVDTILDLLVRLRLADGMSAEEHYGFEPGDTEELFKEPLFRLAKKETFQFGLNNLYVFERM